MLTKMQTVREQSLCRKAYDYVTSLPQACQRKLVNQTFFNYYNTEPAWCKCRCELELQKQHQKAQRVALSHKSDNCFHLSVGTWDIEVFINEDRCWINRDAEGVSVGLTTQEHEGWIDEEMASILAKRNTKMGKTMVSQLSKLYARVCVLRNAPQQVKFPGGSIDEYKRLIHQTKLMPKVINSDYEVVAMDIDSPDDMDELEIITHQLSNITFA